MSEEQGMGSDLHDAALRAGVFQVVEREAKAAKDQARHELMAKLPFGDTVAGRVGDELLCKAGWSKGATKAAVTDPAAFLAWVKEHHPTEVVESVNTAYQSTLKPVGDKVIDADGLVVDGMEVVAGNPSLSVRSEKNALELVQQLVADGRVSLGAIRELASHNDSTVDAVHASYSLAEVRNGTGWPRGVRFTVHTETSADPQCPHCDETPCRCAEIVTSEADDQKAFDASVCETNGHADCRAVWCRCDCHDVIDAEVIE